MERYYRAFYYKDDGERAYLDFKHDTDGAKEYAESAGMGDLICLTKLPACYSPYDVAYQPSQECCGACPSDSANEAKDGLGHEVLPSGRDEEHGRVLHPVFGTCPMDGHAGPRGVHKRVEHLLHLLVGKKD